jgi:hypothetical protein
MGRDQEDWAENGVGLCRRPGRPARRFALGLLEKVQVPVS